MKTLKNSQYDTIVEITIKQIMVKALGELALAKMQSKPTTNRNRSPFCSIKPKNPSRELPINVKELGEETFDVLGRRAVKKKKKND